MESSRIYFFIESIKTIIINNLIIRVNKNSIINVFYSKIYNTNKHTRVHNRPTQEHSQLDALF